VARRLPEWPIGVVTATLAAAVVLVATDHFRRGTILFALGVLLAAGLRLVLSDARAGVLRVRSKALDVATLVFLGLATGVLAIAVPLPH
jgi:hypothetical protein